MEIHREHYVHSCRWQKLVFTHTGETFPGPFLVRSGAFLTPNRQMCFLDSVRNRQDKAPWMLTCCLNFEALWFTACEWCLTRWEYTWEGCPGFLETVLVFLLCGIYSVTCPIWNTEMPNNSDSDQELLVVTSNPYHNCQFLNYSAMIHLKLKYPFQFSFLLYFLHTTGGVVFP